MSVLDWFNPASWVGTIIGNIGGKVADVVLSWHKSNLDAANTEAAIKADLAKRELALQQRESEVNASEVIAEQGHWFTRSVRPAWSWAFIVYTWKVVVWDKVIGSFMGYSCDKSGVCNSFNTDPLGSVVGPLMITIAGAYFTFRGLQYVAQEWQKPKLIATKRSVARIAPKDEVDE
jgi:hypothetical protein